jgi:hypothetical protein
MAMENDVRIVKVQLSLFTTYSKQRLKVYDESKQWHLECPASADIINKMNGQNKLYFYARLNNKDGKIELIKQAPWQEW